MKLIIIAFCMVWSSATALAQKPVNKKQIRFHSINQVGILAGSSDASLQLQTINGIKKKTWFAGLGVGLDYYYVRSIPVFLDVRKNIFDKPVTPFVYADGGYQFPWSSKKDEAVAWWGDEKTKGGIYYELGIGYKTLVLKKMRLLFSAGYSYKNISQTVNGMPWLSIWPPPREAYEKHEYSLRRIAIKAGLSF
ncbi:MAG TPA: hypothetical protein VNA26_05005 [Chitinophagaceae bacterium]|nr:hypothetical protein [Chitinophagaceae bacterium]